jgi:hypothetical protein
MRIRSLHYLRVVGAFLKKKRPKNTKKEREKIKK